MFVNSPKTYGLVAQTLHWAIAALILTLIPLGLYMEALPAGSAAEVDHKSWFYSLHKTFGIAVFTLAILRVGWALVQPHPKPLNADRPLETLAAQTVHWALYGAIIAMPLSGWLHHSALEGFAPIWWPLPQDLPLVPKNPQLAAVFGTVHYFTVILLGICLVLHIGGALKHAFVDRDGTLARMVPFRAVDVPDDLAEPTYRRLPAALAIGAFAVVGLATLTAFVTGPSDGPAALASMGNAAAQPAGWQVDRQNSRLDIQIVQSGAAVTGQFAGWSAIIDFDPADLASARVAVEIDIASLSLGAVTERALSADFLDAEQHPVAKFEADDFVETGPEAYEARGQLQLAGQTRPVTLPFTLRIEDGRAFMQGSVALKRLDFDIGREGFSTDQMIGFDVEVLVVLEAQQAAAG